MGQRAQVQGDDVAARAILDSLARASRPLQPLEVARHVHLSTLVVVPALSRLVDHGLVVRDQRARSAHGGPACWTYRLTARGMRRAPSTALRTG